MDQHIESIFAKLEGATAKNTLRAYRADFSSFEKWCRADNIVVQSHTCEDYIAYIHAQSQNCSVATLNRRLAALKSLFSLAHFPDHSTHIDVVIALKKIKRAKGSAQQQATPLTAALITQLLPFCGTGVNRLRNEILLRLGNETMRRRSELCRFQFSDLHVMPGPRYAIRLRFSKTDQTGKGKMLPLSEQLYHLLMQWHVIVGDGFILRGIKRGEFITPSLAPSSINRIIQAIQTNSGIMTEPLLSGHSFRVGGALDLLMNGVTLEKIMLRGGWTSESSVMRYLQAWNLLDD